MRLERDMERGPVRAESLVGGRELIDRLAPAWRELCAEGPCDEPFYRPEWFAAWYDAFGAGTRLRVVVVRRGDRVRAVLPLVESWSKLRGIPVRMLRGAANVHSCRFDIVHGASDADEAGRALWEELQRAGGFEVLELPDVPEGGLAQRMLSWAESAGHPIGRWESMRTPFVPLPGRNGDFEAMLGAATTSKFRANVRRRRRKLEEKGAVTFERITHADAAALQAFYDLEAAGWKGEKGTAIGCEGATRSFYDRIAAWAEREGCLSLYALRLEGVPVAMHYGLTWGGRYFLPKPAFDESHGACSPGQLLLHDVLRDCVERGLVEFDFLGPWMDWKADWTEHVRPHHWCYVFRRGPVGLALHAAKFRIADWVRGK
ncbi:GNAT family N-acetyltransferase [Vulgatibacter sp.]|uniref:GNAT family N-acetyltransferase n=1 Tax=Vulgatibacter sp. TaxID=1971226 RepID=UPI0035670E4A